MKPWSDVVMNQKLSLYLDGALSVEEAKQVEEYLLQHPDAGKELEQLKKLKGLLASQQRLRPDAAFWTRLLTRLEHHEEEQRSLIPIPKRFVPVAALGGVVGVVVLGTLFFQNRARVNEYIAQKSEAMKKVYNETLLKGSVLPLFANLDRNDALQFGLSGTLALDKNSGTALRVDESSQQGYRIEVAKTSGKKVKQLTVDQFMADIKPTQQQRRLIDTLLDDTRKRIERAVLVGENEAVAIDPNLPQLNKQFVSSIAACLGPDQRERFGKLLERNDAPYSFRSTAEKPVEPEVIVKRFREVPTVRHYVVVTPDTLVINQIQLDVAALQQQMESDLQLQEELFARRARLLERLASRSANSDRSNTQPPAPDSAPEVFRVQIEHMLPTMPALPVQVDVVPRARRQRVFVSSPGVNGFEIHIDEDSTSVVGGALPAPKIRFYHRIPSGGMEIVMGDSISSMNEFRNEAQRRAAEIRQLSRSIQRKARMRTNVDSSAN